MGQRTTSQRTIGSHKTTICVNGRAMVRGVVRCPRQDAHSAVCCCALYTMVDRFRTAFRVTGNVVHTTVWSMRPHKDSIADIIVSFSTPSIGATP